jgi:hypothetical protein
MNDRVPRKHLFRRLTNVHQVWPFVEGEDDAWMEPSDPRPPKVEPVEETPRTVGEHPAMAYMDRRLHDARVVNVEVGEDSIRIDVDDYDVWRLSTAYENVTGVSAGDRYFPVRLEFNHVNAWAAFQINPLGKLSRLRRSLRSNLAKIHGISGDRIVRWDANRIVVFIEMRLRFPRETRLFWDPRDRVGVTHVHDLLLAVDAESLEVREGQRAAWMEAFGAGSEGPFDTFIRRRLALAQGPFEALEELVRESRDEGETKVT